MTWFTWYWQDVQHAHKTNTWCASLTWCTWWCTWCTSCTSSTWRGACRQNDDICHSICIYIYHHHISTHTYKHQIVCIDTKYWYVYLYANILHTCIYANMQGYEVEHGGKTITIFSAPNYCDQMGNKGAFIHLDATLKVRVCCGVLQRVAACCSVLQCVAVCCSVLRFFWCPTAEIRWAIKEPSFISTPSLRYVCVAVCCSVLQRVGNKGAVI